MLVEEAPGSTRPLHPRSPLFPVSPDFEGASYIKRYEILCLRLVRERFYNAACLITSQKQDGLRGLYNEPCNELSFDNFVASLSGFALGYARKR